jgi:uncharacterized NAD(P)/FAD-binding protein YdhS
MKKIAIIGSGVSGTLLALNLIRKHQGGLLEITLIEKYPCRLNKGVAYSTRDDYHLLNVRAAGMSIYPENALHFHDWLCETGYSFSPSDFVPRRIFADYVESEFENIIEQKGDNISIKIIFDEAVDIHTGLNSYLIFFKNGLSVHCDLVVLALGQISISEIETLKYSNIKNYFRTPWNNKQLCKIKPDQRVLLIGSGLTSDDMILTLCTDLNRTGTIYSLSRSGLRPLPHSKLNAWPAFYDEIKDRDLNAIFSVVRKQIKKAGDARVVIDSLRPYTSKIWASLTEIEKSRFLRHLNKYWNVVRHRMPESTHETLNRLEQSGLLKYLSGNIVDIKQDSGKINVLFKKATDKNSNTISSLEVDVIINCIGPESNYKRINMPLIKNLFNRGIISQNETGISIKARDWSVINTNGEKTGILTLGPLLKGELFESTAVPEIRVQAEQLAEHINKNLL